MNLSSNKFNLENSLVFFDIESTGLNILQDRIIQIALVKYIPNQEKAISLVKLIDPMIPISLESLEVHGISNDDLIGKPRFAEVANELFNFIGDSDLAGYNSNKFDIPLLLEEFHRVGIDFDLEKRRTIDMAQIFFKMEPRTLAGAMRFYTGKELENAHDALVDVQATIDVFIGQIKKYKGIDYQDGKGRIIHEPIKNDIQSIHDFTNDPTIIDNTRRLKYNKSGEVVFNFGKYINQSVISVLKKDRNYYNWIMEKDFSIQVKKSIKKLLHQGSL